jgi:hypothetical protein
MGEAPWELSVSVISLFISKGTSKKMGHTAGGTKADHSIES